MDSLIPEYGGNLFNMVGIEGRVRVNVTGVRDEHSMKCLVQGQDVVFNLASRPATSIPCTTPSPTWRSKPNPSFTSWRPAANAILTSRSLSPAPGTTMSVRTRSTRGSEESHA